MEGEEEFDATSKEFEVALVSMGVGGADMDGEGVGGGEIAAEEQGEGEVMRGIGEDGWGENGRAGDGGQGSAGGQ